MKRLYIFLLMSACTVWAGCNSGKGQRETFGGGELFYTDGASADDAHKLGKYLQSVGFFSDESAQSAQLAKRGNTYVFRLVVKDDAVNDESMARIFAFMSMDISADVFDQAPVDIELTDENLLTQKTIASPGERSINSKAIVYRFNEVDKATADRVNAYLTQIGFIGQKEVTLAYSRRGDDFIYECITEEGAEDRPEVVKANQAIAGMLSAEVLQNKPVTLHFLAEDYSIKRIYSFDEILTAYREFIADSAGSSK